MDNNRFLQDKGWANMKVVLDKEMPEKKRRSIFILWLFPSVAATLVALFWVFPISFHRRDLDEKYLATNVHEKDIELLNSATIDLNKITEEDHNSFSNISQSSKLEILKDNESINNEVTKNSIIPKGTIYGSDFQANQDHSHINAPNKRPLQNRKNCISQIVAKATTKKHSNELGKATTFIEINKGNEMSAENILRLSDKTPLQTTEGLSENLVNQPSETHVIMPNNVENSNSPQANEDSRKEPSKLNEIRNDLLVLEEQPIVPQAKVKNSVLGMDFGYGHSLDKGYNDYTLGFRYKVKAQKAMDVLFRMGGYYMPTEINYSSTYLADQNAGFTSNVTINNTIKSLTGLLLSSQINYNLALIPGSYLFGGVGVKTAWQINRDNTKELLLAQSNSRDKLSFNRDQQATLRAEKFGLMGQIGLGYRYKNYGIEVMYRPSQNVFRNSSVKGIDHRLNHFLGANAIFYF